MLKKFKNFFDKNTSNIYFAVSFFYVIISFFESYFTSVFLHIGITFIYINVLLESKRENHIWIDVDKLIENANDIEKHKK